MASSSPSPDNVGLRYGSAEVFDRADTHASVVARLAPGDPFTVHGTEGEFYRVRLQDQTEGFVYAQNLMGRNMPLTANEQRNADERAAFAARPSGGWRGLLQRFRNST
ncbi:MAG TPA: SH3 domain-containing protein [Chloroflexota bacterium]|nr:SH3 domain-containing protein [Chloroflexota bacterium]